MLIHRSANSFYLKLTFAIGGNLCRLSINIVVILLTPIYYKCNKSGGRNTDSKIKFDRFYLLVNCRR